MEDLRIISDKTRDALLSGGAKMAQYTVSQTETLEFNVSSGEFSLLRTLYDNSLSIVAYVDNRMGHASGNKFDDASIAAKVADCLASAKSGTEDSAYAIAPKQENACFHDGAYEPDTDRLFARTREFMDDIARNYPKVLVTEMMVSHVKRHSLYRNTNGTEFETQKGYYEIGVEFAGHDEDATTSFCFEEITVGDLDTPFLELGNLKKAFADAEAQLTTIPLTGKFEGTLILTPGSLSSFLYSIAELFVSDAAVLEKTSPWLDKLHEKVADPRISISIDPFHPCIVCGERYTDDGFASESFDLIKDGTLRSFLISLYVANKSGLPRAKATAPSLVMAGGDTSYEDMIKNTDRGIILGRFSGGNPSINGDFSGVAKNSFLVENGKVVGCVNEVMVSGNLADLLNNLITLSRETVANGSCVLPYAAFDHVTISGK